MLQPTPISPVDATSTGSDEHRTSRAVSSAIRLAASNPDSPVQAFAQPLLAMMARAVPPDLTRCSRETTTGAACARFVVNTAADVAGRSDTRRARSKPAALTPAATPASRKPLGV